MIAIIIVFVIFVIAIIIVFVIFVIFVIAIIIIFVIFVSQDTLQVQAVSRPARPRNILLSNVAIHSVCDYLLGSGYQVRCM